MTLCDIVASSTDTDGDVETAITDCSRLVSAMIGAVNDSVLGALSSCEETLLLIHELSRVATMTLCCDIFASATNTDSDGDVEAAITACSRLVSAIIGADNDSV